MVRPKAGRRNASPSGLASLVSGAALLLALGCGGRGPTGWNLLVVTLDTTRADILGCYGKERAGTPNLDRLAAEGFLFLDAMSAAPVTLPSHSTIFTGTYPPRHGVRDNGLFSLPEERTTLAEILGEAGYDTGAAIGSFPLDRQFGLAQGFDLYEDHVTVASESFRGERVAENSAVYFDERPAPRVNEAILPWLRTPREAPFFAWIHYWDPHYPHIPPPPFNQRFHNDLYQGELAFADQALGAVLDELESQGVYDRTVIVVTADHGEGRGEHQEGTHAILAYNTTLRVPLIVRVPGMDGGVRLGERVGTVDIVPSVLDLLGLAAPPTLQGRSLVPLMEAPANRPANRLSYYAEALTPRLSRGLGELRVLFLGPYKYIHGPRPELFDLESDPRELRDLTGELVDETESMRSTLERRLGEIASSDAEDAVQGVDAQTRARLEALGYLSTSGADPTAIREVLDSSGAAPQDRVSLIGVESELRVDLSENDFLAARERASRLMEVDPESSFYRAMFVRALVGLGHLEEAARVAEETADDAVAKNPDEFLLVANGLFGSGQHLRAVRLAERVAEAGRSANAYSLLGEMHGGLGNYPARDEALRQALVIQPDHPLARLSLAIHQVQAGRLAQAEEELGVLLLDYPLFARAHYNYGVLLLQQRRWEEALARLERTVEIEPTYWRAYLGQIAAYRALDRRREAERILERLEACPDPEVRRNAEQLLAGA